MRSRAGRFRWATFPRARSRRPAYPTSRRCSRRSCSPPSRRHGRSPRARSRTRCCSRCRARWSGSRSSRRRRDGSWRSSRRPQTAALRGLRIRIIDNRQTAADLRAVGARPVEGLTAERRPLSSGAQARRRRVERDEHPGNGYQTVAHYFSTYSPFPKFQAIVVNRTVWECELTARSRRRFAQRHATRSPRRCTRDRSIEQQELIELCEAEAVPATPTPAQLAQLAVAMRSTTPHVVTSAGGKELLAQLLRLPGDRRSRLCIATPRSVHTSAETAPFVHRGGATSSRRACTR